MLKPAKVLKVGKVVVAALGLHRPVRLLRLQLVAPPLPLTSRAIGFPS